MQLQISYMNGTLILVAAGQFTEAFCTGGSDTMGAKLCYFGTTWGVTSAVGVCVCGNV